MKTMPTNQSPLISQVTDFGGLSREKCCKYAHKNRLWAVWCDNVSYQLGGNFPAESLWMQYAWTESDPPYSLTAESNVSVQNTINRSSVETPRTFWTRNASQRQLQSELTAVCTDQRRFSFLCHNKSWVTVELNRHCPEVLHHRHLQLQSLLSLIDYKHNCFSSCCVSYEATKPLKIFTH